MDLNFLKVISERLIGFIIFYFVLESEFKFMIGDALKNSNIFECKKVGTICIEHKTSTSRELVGLQVILLT